MTSPAKLYAKLLDNPNVVISFRDFEQMLRAFGFALRGQSGSHRSYRHPATPTILTIQPNGKDAVPYQVRKFLAMVEAYGLTLGD